MKRYYNQTTMVPSLSEDLWKTNTFRTSATISPPCLLDSESTWNKTKLFICAYTSYSFSNEYFVSGDGKKEQKKKRSQNTIEWIYTGFSHTMFEKTFIQSLLHMKFFITEMQFFMSEKPFWFKMHSYRQHQLPEPFCIPLADMSCVADLLGCCVLRFLDSHNLW